MCQNSNCSSDSLDIVQNACYDNTTISALMSTPLTTSTDVNQYIDEINSDYSYQLAELTVFQFPNTPESKIKYWIISISKNLYDRKITIIIICFTWYISVTISCDIALTPKQTINEYKLRHVSNIESISLFSMIDKLWMLWFKHDQFYIWPVRQSIKD